MKADEEYDLVVLGAGAGGMTAALVAALEGLQSLVVERSGQVGGTTARSSGTVWIPNNHHLHGLGIEGDDRAARAYLGALVGDKAEPALREAFIEAAPAMLRYLEERADLRFQPYPRQPDYHQELPGAVEGGRALEPLPFDGRILGPDFDKVAWPLPELMLFGRMMVTRAEAARLLRAATSWDGLALGARLIVRYLADRTRWRRGTRLVLGNALAARLFHNLRRRAVPVWLNAAARRLIVEQGRVRGLVVERGGAELTIGARGGVVMAGGGFPASPELCERYLPKPMAQYTAAYQWCRGETILLAQSAGAALGPPGEDNALWFPSSIGRRRDGTTAVYPHIVLDRAKPGLIAVNAAGRRFVNEAVSYHRFTRAMYRAHQTTPAIPAMLICDHRFLWNYGLGMVRPRTPWPGRFVKSGYLKAAATLEELARKIGVDGAGLADTVNRHNEFARTGVDADFGKGANAYDRWAGDAEHRPNPCLGPIEQPPFYAVALVPTPLGTSLGLLTNRHSQTLDASGRPIEGLYACGNDMHSAVGGEYPGAGAQLGLAMTFGYLVAMHAAKAAGAQAA